MFTHAFDGYMEHAFPEGELLPLSCRGAAFELAKVPLVTLIDAMDTLAVMGNGTEFRRAVRLVTEHADFHVDQNVSVFETTIRILGGLLSAHLLASDPAVGMYSGACLSSGSGARKASGKSSSTANAPAAKGADGRTATENGKGEGTARKTNEADGRSGSGGNANDTSSSSPSPPSPPSAALERPCYDGSLLPLAVDLGDRLIPAFDTKTG
ncbi:unnamed protein product, partial [Phaeothamnion confervicola]